MRDPHVHGAHAVDLGSGPGRGAGRGADKQPQEPTPGSMLRVSYGAATDRGLRRELNEDSFIAMDPVFAVADGMGGHEAGEVASSICVRTLGASSVIGTRGSQFTTEHLEDLIGQADEQIRIETGGQAGTTVSGAVLVEEAGQPHWLFFNAGDSRTYRLSNGTFGQISVDHSEVQEMVDLGRISEEEARTHPRRHVITRALGTGDDAEADTWLLPVEEGDRLLICSDGLSGELTDDEICTLLSTVQDPQEACDELVAATLRSGARDNVTVLVVDATTTDDQETPPARGGTLFAADTDGTPSG
jgi:serine/threonine protein phosphatase PrpC